jgi:threonyl-tRNA synthetase
VQVAIVPITDAQLEYARHVAERARLAGLRVWVNEQNEKLGAKIRLAETQKVPAMFVVGAREAQTESVAVRRHGLGDQGTKSLEEAIAALVSEDRSRALEPVKGKEQ